jgi:glycerophosphoryl diester phosphodiesterase
MKSLSYWLFASTSLALIASPSLSAREAAPLSTPSTSATSATSLAAERALRDEFAKIYKDHGVLPIPIHRGGGMHQPENTIEAFEYSWERNMVPEADIRTTKDGVIVVIHDETVTRTAPDAPAAMHAKKISELTLAELKTLDVGAFRGQRGQRIPTLDEVFAVMAKDPAKFLHLDYKAIDIPLLSEMVKRHGIEKQVIFTTDRYDLIQQWRALIPTSQTMIWMGGSQQEIENVLNNLRANRYEDIYIVHMHYRPVTGGNGFNMSDNFMLKAQAELAAQGIVLQIQPWNIEDPQIYERLFQIGIRNVGTDFPDMLNLIRPDNRQ